MRLRRAVLLASVVLAIEICGSPLSAGAAVIDHGRAVSQVPASTPTNPPFNVYAIEPGWSHSQTFGVHNDNSKPSALSLTADDVADDDIGCTSSRALIESPCGPGQGELGHEMRFSIFVNEQRGGAFPQTPQWIGTIYDLTQSPVVVKYMPAGATWQVRVAASLPTSSGNETQSDRLDFHLHMFLQGNVVQVLGTTFARGADGSSPSTGALSGMLPFTGSPVLMLVVASLLLLGTGGALFKTSRSPAHDQG